jgi:Cd2+/Zn2+-exporting ATPase
MAEQRVPVTAYPIRGLDCAQCAATIESELRSRPGMEEAAVSFATSTIYLPADRLDEAQQIISRVEPEARLAEGGGHADSPDKRAERAAMLGRIMRFGAGLVLSVAGLVFRDAIRATPFRWADFAVFLSAYLLVGFPVLRSAGRNILRGRVFDEMFLMSVATLGAIVIDELPEAVAVMLFYAVGEYFQDLAVARSRRSISSLMDLRPDTVRLVTADGLRQVDPDGVAVGDLIEVIPGERIPLDGEVVEGGGYVDTAALTGESVPRAIAFGDSVLSGFVNESDLIRLRVTAPASQSTVARILELVENAAARKAPTERFISRFAAVYTPIIVVIAAAVAFLPPLIIPGATFSLWTYRALVILVISCPCALVISIPLGYFGGIGAASRSRILIKGANFIDALRDVTTVVVDKTGTLTEGTFDVLRTVSHGEWPEQDLLLMAAWAESYSTHPVARSIRRAAAEISGTDGRTDQAGTTVPSTAGRHTIVPGSDPENVSEERGLGVVATGGGVRVVAGSDRLMRREGVVVPSADGVGRGATTVHLAIDGAYAGYVVVADRTKEEAAEAVRALRREGIERIVMLTGDTEANAARVAGEVGISEYFAGLLPHEKVERIEELEAELSPGRKLAFVGDGINDAPVLVRADVGVAMGALGSDAAIEAADVVLMDDKLDRLPTALGIARFTRKVVIQNIVIALAVKGGFLALGTVGLATMWEAVIADVGVALLAVLNATRTTRRAG